MKYFVIFSLLFALSAPVLAQEIYLRDVPEGHYAYDAVYDLIKRGVTGGFPDGTFRGKKLVSRYELASFISKLSRSFKLKQGSEEKLVEELRSELSLIKYQQEKREKEIRIAGNLTARWRAGQSPGRRGAGSDYRLRAAVTRNFGDAASLKVNLDTMDGGYNGGSRDLSRELLDFEGKVKLGSAALRVTAGPGDVTHADDGLFPWENGVRYRRPRRTISLSSALGRTNFYLEHLTRSTDPSGLIGVEEISFKIVQNFDPLKVTLNPRTFSDRSGQRDNRIDLSGELDLGAVRPSLLLGLAKTSDHPHGLYARGELSVANWLKVLAQKIGSQYRETFSYGIFDLYDRDLPDGSTNLGLELSQPLGGDWAIKFKGDYRQPGEVVTTEWHLGRRLNSASTLELIYHTFQADGFSQALGLTAAITL